MIILFNFNTYLGGGETLFVRFISFLFKQEEPFHAYCKEGSFIAKQLKKEGLPDSVFTSIKSKSDYPYLSQEERVSLLNEIDGFLPKSDKYYYLSFCLRELYMLIDLNKRHQGSISHLVLHNQDYLYLGRTIWDGVIEKLTKKKVFHNDKFLSFNKHIINLVNQQKGLIPMSWIISQLWKKEIAVDIPEDMIVSLPSFCDKNEVTLRSQNNKKIIFIGRLVDFKFASLFAIFNYIKRNPTYQLTVVGSGDKERALKYISENAIPLDNIHFAGEVAYTDLPKIISDHSIGYAAGTSIIECAQQGLPVIMALQNNANKPFHKDICGGLFCNTTKGNLGEDLCLYSEDSIPITIDDTIKEIEADYISATQRCFDYVRKEYSINLNFREYLCRIKNSAPIDTSKTKVPRTGGFRRFLYKKV